jgi:hypothetical protein
MNPIRTLWSALRKAPLFSRPDPARDWIALILLSGVALVGIVAWNASAFDTISGGGVIGTRATSTPPIFTQTSLDTLHAIFDTRQAEEEKYVNGEYRYADPSQ